MPNLQFVKIHKTTTSYSHATFLGSFYLILGSFKMIFLLIYLGFDPKLLKIPS